MRSCGTQLNRPGNVNLISPLGAAPDTWELPWPRLRVPSYRETRLGPWYIRKIDQVPQRGYFQDLMFIVSQYTLFTSDNTWMSTAPIETEGQAPHVAAARGHVAMMGAGLGLALYNILPKAEVTRVTLVEREPQVIDLLRQATDMDQWVGIEKLNIKIMDAFDYCPSDKVNHLYIDIWPMTGDPQALSDVQRVQKQVKADAVSWWTQEIAFLRWLEHKEYGHQPSLEHYREWAREVDLPLIEQDHAAYMACVSLVACSVFYKTVRGQEREAAATGETG